LRLYGSGGGRYVGGGNTVQKRLDSSPLRANNSERYLVIFHIVGNFDVAFEFLELAVTRSAALVYDEPWGWMQPPLHALGALLLEQVCNSIAVVLGVQSTSDE
jgi:hypothetical protein